MVEILQVGPANDLNGLDVPRDFQNLTSDRKVRNFEMFTQMCFHFAKFMEACSQLGVSVPPMVFNRHTVMTDMLAELRDGISNNTVAIHLREFRAVRDKIIVNNTGLAKRFSFLILRALGGFDNRVDFEHVYSDGYLGLIAAVDQFDLDRNKAFSTYAYWQIKGAVSRFLDRERGLKRVGGRAQGGDTDLFVTITDDRHSEGSALEVSEHVSRLINMLHTKPEFENSAKMQLGLTVLLQCTREGKTVTEVADQLELSLGRALDYKKLVINALKKLDAEIR